MSSCNDSTVSLNRIQLFPCWHSAEWFWHENPATSDCPGYIWPSPALTQVWHTHTVPELEGCCERLRLHSATKVFSQNVKCSSILRKITPPRPPLPPFLYLFFSVNVWQQSHPRGKTKSPESWSQLFYQKHDTGPWWQCLAFPLFPAYPTCWKLNAIRRVGPSKWSLSKCYCFLNVVREERMCWNLPLAQLILLSTT